MDSRGDAEAEKKLRVEGRELREIEVERALLFGRWGTRTPAEEVRAETEGVDYGRGSIAHQTPIKNEVLGWCF